MKARGSRVIGEQSNTRNKAETLANGPSNSQQTSAQAIRKRRSSINVYDQPSSLNARLRQLETDMLRLDEDRTKLFDDTHSALAQYELRLSEIQAILKSRQDNAEKYVEDMKILLQAKDDFERQAKILSEKHERMQDKFMHRETTVSRDIKLLKNKFELLEKNRQFKSVLQKSGQNKKSSDNNEDGNESATRDGSPGDPLHGKETSEATGETDDSLKLGIKESQGEIQDRGSTGGIGVLGSVIGQASPLRRVFDFLCGASKKSIARVRRKSNRIGSIGPISLLTVEAAQAEGETKTGDPPPT